MSAVEHVIFGNYHHGPFVGVHELSTRGIPIMRMLIIATNVAVTIKYIVDSTARISE